MALRALITGVTGQDGSYLAEFLLERGYEVFGIVRTAGAPNYERIAHLGDRITLLRADLLDEASVMGVLSQARANEIYNLAAQSFVPVSWEEPLLTGDSTGLSVARLLQAICRQGLNARFYQASSSEMFGKAVESPQRESTPLCPRSPYAAAKTYAHHLTVAYRERYGLFACCGILFNHESPRRSIEFVSRKISQRVAQIKLGRERELRMGNLEARRDWGFAGDYVAAMWQMLQQDQPDDFVIGTGIPHSVAELLEIAFRTVGLEWREFVKVDESLLRPLEAHLLVADTANATRELGWKPKVTFTDLIAMMVEHDIYRLQKGMPLYAAVTAQI